MSNFAQPHSEGPVNQSPERGADAEGTLESPSQFMVDNRPEAVAQRKLQASLDNRPQVQQHKSLLSSVGRSPVQHRSAQPPALSFGEAKGTMQRACDGRGQDDSCITGPMEQVKDSDAAQLQADPEVSQLLTNEFVAGPVQRQAESDADYDFLY